MDIYALSTMRVRSCQRSRSRWAWSLPWISLDTSWEESVWLHASALTWGGLPQDGVAKERTWAEPNMKTALCSVTPELSLPCRPVLPGGAPGH